MKRLHAALLMSLLALGASAHAQRPAPGHAPSDFRLSGVTLREGRFLGQPALEMRMPSSSYQDPAREKLSDRDFMAWLPVDFHNGIIEVDVASELASDAPAYARGFIGLSFRIEDKGADGVRFESIYLRPTNSTADDQVRRNHSIQYAAFPDFRFDLLRNQWPEKYESYADIATGRWIRMKIVVEGEKARLYLDGNPRPAFIVNDLKLGAQTRGGVGVWLESGTIAYFHNLRITRAD
jgi:hypothetical protein